MEGRVLVPLPDDARKSYQSCNNTFDNCPVLTVIRSLYWNLNDKSGTIGTHNYYFYYSSWLLSLKLLFGQIWGSRICGKPGCQQVLLISAPHSNVSFRGLTDWSRKFLSTQKRMKKSVVRFLLTLFASLVNHYGHNPCAVVINCRGTLTLNKVTLIKSIRALNGTEHFDYTSVTV